MTDRQTDGFAVAYTASANPAVELTALPDFLAGVGELDAAPEESHPAVGTSGLASQPMVGRS